MRNLWIVSCCIIFFLPIMTASNAQDNNLLPPEHALAIDPATWEVIYFEGNDHQVLATLDQETNFSFGRTANGPAVVAVTGSDEISIMTADGDVQDFSVPLLNRTPPILVDNNIFFYAAPDVWDTFADTPFYTAEIASIDVTTGAVSEVVSGALFNDGCAGMPENLAEETIWIESQGFGNRRALERIQTAEFDGFISTLDACDRGVFAVEFGTTDAEALRILDENIQDWAVSPDGTQVIGTGFPAYDMVDILLVTVLTGEQKKITTGPYDRVTWLDDNTLLVGKRIPTDTFLSDKMTTDEATLYGSTRPQPADTIPVYDVRLVTVDIETGAESSLTDPIPDAYGFLRAYVFDDVIYAAIIPDGTAYASAMLAAQSTPDLDDDADAQRLLAPSIYAIDPENGDFELIVDGYLYWKPFRD